MFAWIDGALTVEMAVGRVGYIRCPIDKNQWPGDVDWSCAIEIGQDGKCEIKILGGKRGPTQAEVRKLIRYFKSLGYSGGWHRYKNGKKPKEVKI